MSITNPQKGCNQQAVSHQSWLEVSFQFPIGMKRNKRTKRLMYKCFPNIVKTNAHNELMQETQRDQIKT